MGLFIEVILIYNLFEVTPLQLNNHLKEEFTPIRLVRTPTENKRLITKFITLKLYKMKFTSMIKIRLILCLALLFTSGIPTIIAQNATDSLMIEHGVKKTITNTNKKPHNPIRTPIIIVSTILCLFVVLGTFVFFSYPGKS